METSRFRRESGHNDAVGKRSRIVLGLLLVAVLGGSAWVVLHPREKGPVWQGKPLSKWLDELDPKTGRLSTPAAEAVQQIGTNGISWLFQEAATGTPFLKQLTMDLLQRQRLIKFHLAPLPDHQAIAQRGFRALGTAGIQAVAEGLTNSDARIRHGCVGQWELGKDYPEILFTPLFNCLKDPDPRVRARAANALGMLGQQPDTVVPALTALLSDPDGWVRNMAALGLSLYGTRAKPAVPALVKMLAKPSPDFEFFGTNALKAIDPVAAAKAGVK